MNKMQRRLKRIKKLSKRTMCKLVGNEIATYQLPNGVIGLWADGDNVPYGWKLSKELKNKFIKPKYAKNRKENRRMVFNSPRFNP